MLLDNYEIYKYIYIKLYIKIHKNGIIGIYIYNNVF
jgi:hypothetical protein